MNHSGEFVTDHCVGPGEHNCEGQLPWSVRLGRTTERLAGNDLPSTGHEPPAHLTGRPPRLVRLAARERPALEECYRRYLAEFHDRQRDD